MIVTVNEFKNIIENDNYFPIVSKGKTNFLNLPLSFDIETTSLYREINTNKYIKNDDFEKISVKEQSKYEKIAFMYIWQFAFKDYQIMGRDWNSFERLIKIFENKLNTQYKKMHIVIYVHNLSYEFQFIKDRFNFIDILALRERKPIKAITDSGIEFRCSYLLSGYSLAKLADNLTNHKIKKLKGDLDYSLIRNNKTELSENEIQYCVNDILIVQYYIQECIDRFGDISQIPNTQTGIVRNYVKKYCLNSKNYPSIIRKMTLTTESFKALKRAFSGGYTHSNCAYSTLTLKNVFSVDFTSSYPYCLVSEKYPTSSPIRLNQKLNETAFNGILKNYLSVFDVVFYDIKSKTSINIISVNKCFEKDDYTVDNGKIIKAKRIMLTVTNIDFDDIKKFYTFTHFEVFNIFLFNSGYLPKPLIECVFKFYNDKTSLKGVAGKEVEYLHSKEMLNSLYGMCVTDIVRDNITYDNVNKQWNSEEVDIDEKIDEYNKSKSRFLFYAWGVFCTSYARHNLYRGIIEMMNSKNYFSDFVYCDTDSIKGLNYESHKKFFDDYNKECEIKLKKMCDYYNFDYSILYPKTKDNKVKIMGVYDFEGVYDRFKTLGSKRYLYEKNKECFLTVAGLGKNAVKYMGNTNDDIFNNFCFGLKLNRNETSKMIHTYIDSEKSGFLNDYQNNLGYFNEKSSIHLENCDFYMNISDDYLDLIMSYFKDINRIIL